MEHPWDRRLGFWYIAEDQPDYPAILDSPDGPRTYGELAGDVHQLVHMLRAMGVGPDEVFGVMADNGNTLIEGNLAASESGSYIIPLNTHLTNAELIAIMEHSGCKVVICSARYADVCTGLPPTVTVLTVGEAPGSGFTTLAEARKNYPRTKPEPRLPGSTFVYTSGTTGKPKGIRRKIRGGDVDQLAQEGALFSRAFDFRPFEGPMLVSTGMFHGGSMSYCMGGIHVGHSLVIMPKFDPEKLLQLIEKYKIRTGYMVPTQFHRLLLLPDEIKKKYDLSSLHSIVHSAAPCPKDVKIKMFDWWGPVIWETYGGMEGAATIAKPHHWLAHPGTVGRAIRGMKLVILDDDGNELPPNVPGNIYLDNGVGFEYHNDPNQTQAAFKGKRFSLGDIGYLTEDGFLFISDRAKDMLITGGVNVYPAEIEAALLDHPKVFDCGVIGIPDPDWGESVMAIVQPIEGVTGGPELQAELEAFCKDKLASYKRPRLWQFRTELPRTEAGKLYKRKIRDEIVASMGSK